jgi:hypothetical protein
MDSAPSRTHVVRPMGWTPGKKTARTTTFDSSESRSLELWRARLEADVNAFELEATAFERSDRLLLNGLVASSPHVLRFADPLLLEDRDFALAAAAANGDALYFLPYFSCDREVVAAAVAESPVALSYAGGSLQCDLELVWRAWRGGFLDAVDALDAGARRTLVLTHVASDARLLEALAAEDRDRHDVLASVARRNPLLLLEPELDALVSTDRALLALRDATAERLVGIHVYVPGRIRNLDTLDALEHHRLEARLGRRTRLDGTVDARPLAVVQHVSRHCGEAFATAHTVEALKHSYRVVYFEVNGDRELARELELLTRCGRDPASVLVLMPPLGALSPAAQLARFVAPRANVVLLCGTQVATPLGRELPHVSIWAPERPEAAIIDLDAHGRFAGIDCGERATARRISRR